MLSMPVPILCIRSMHPLIKMYDYSNMSEPNVLMLWPLPNFNCKQTKCTLMTWSQTEVFLWDIFQVLLLWFTTCKRGNTRPHQLDGIFRSELFNHGMEVPVPCVRRSATLLSGRSRRVRGLIVKAHILAFFQQKHRPLHEGKALPGGGHRDIS